MKKLFAITLCISLIALFAFQNNDTAASKDTPSVFQPILTENLSDTTDLDAEMAKLEKEMKILENKMKPYEMEMKQWEAKMKPYQNEMKQWEMKMKPYEKQMKELERKMRNATTDSERNSISNEMSAVGNKMSDVGNEMGKVGNKMGDIGNEMGAVGNKMSAVGEEMSKIGNKMSIIGAEMGKRHRKIFSWFFQELKRDGLLKGDKCSIFMEQNVLIVNALSLNTAPYEKYKKGIEARLGKPLKADFSFYFKGKISNITEEGFDFDGNMNSHY